MPLSEHEQQLLEQMEQALYAEDPKFASQMQGAGARAAARRRVAIGVVGVILGLALVLVGVNTTMWLGAAGFAIMVGAVAFALTPPRRGKAALGAVQPDGTVRREGPRPKATQAKGAGKGAVKGARSRRGTGSFMNRMEERWDRRKGGGY
ncbi:MAG: DUF3040 domain-containing protein [Pedococcus sp.]